jgi:hypothetical protein
MAPTTPTLAPFVDQQTVLLTTFRRDGTPVSTAVSIAVENDHAVIRTFDTAEQRRVITAGVVD